MLEDRNMKGIDSVICSADEGQLRGVLMNLAHKQGISDAVLLKLFADEAFAATHDGCYPK